MSAAAPQISVIVPAYGVSAWIGEAVASALGQDTPAAEVIVVNDGSPDTPDMEQALGPFMDRITYLVQPNRGAAAARNAGLAIARSEWVAFLDGDDAWEPSFLRRQLAWAAAQQLDMVWSNGIIVGEVSEAGRAIITGPQPEHPASVASLIQQQHSVVTSATLVRREALERIKGFDERLRRAQDFDLWVRLVHAGAKAGFNPDLLVRHRVRPGNLSGGAADQVDRALEVMLHVQRHLPLGPSDAAVLRVRLSELEAHRALLGGKDHLRHRRFAEARAHLAAANVHFGQRRLRLLLLVMGFAPALARWIYLRASRDHTG